MKKCLLIMLLLLPLVIEAQIKVLEDTPKPTSKPYVVLYDSLSNISTIRDDSIKHHESYKHLIGQTIFYVEPDDTKSRVHHKSFYDTPEIKYGTTALPYESCMNRYWKITNIVNYKPPFAVADKEIFELTDTTDGKRVYCEPRNMNRDFIVVGFYEKIKENYIGKTFIYNKTYFSEVWDNDRYNYLMDLQTKKHNKDIPEKTKWKCIDIAAYNVTKQDAMYDDYECRCPIILVFENDSLGKYYSYVQTKTGKPFKDTKNCYWITDKGHEEESILLYLGKFLDEEQEAYISKRDKEEKQYFEAQKKKMLKKYGKYWGKLVAEGQLEIGMTKQMCRDSWGEPEDINTTSTRYGTHEQWVYTTIYVYFDNGKISAIQDR